MKTSQYIAIGIGCFGILWILSGFLFGGAAPSADQKKQESAVVEAAAGQSSKGLQKVRVRELKAEAYPETVVVTGRSQASRSIDMRAETNAQVKEILKQEGARVEEGEVMAKLEVKDREARLEEARQRLAQRQIQYDAAKRLEDKGFNSKVRLAEALADLEDARAIFKTAQVELSKTDIVAPFEAIIARQDIELGDYVSSGNALFTLVDLDPIEFVGFVSEQNIQKLKLGLEGRAELLSGDEVAGKISYIAPAADPQTRTFRVIMSAENPDFIVKEGLTARLLIPVEDKTAFKISPSILALNDDGVVGVKIVNDQNKVEFVEIEILSDKPGEMYIYGPPKNARIITVGQNFVIEDQEVQPVPAEGDGLL